MSKYDRLKKESDKAFAATKDTIESRSLITKELNRVSNIVNNAGVILSDLDKRFIEATKLSSADISLLFLATALQCTRQYLFSNEKFRIHHNQGDRLVSTFVPKRWEDILLGSVPYDAIRLSANLKSEFGSIGISGVTHRFRTLGHDPILGWIFGTVNILSSSLTKTDIVSTYQVQMPYITSLFPGGTAGAFQHALQQVEADKFNLPAAVTRQALHFGTDYFTKQGLPIPFLSTVNNNLSKDFLMKYNIDMWSITKGASISILINVLISCIHNLFYNEKLDQNIDLYKVRTSKILSYSNSIATSSNLLYVAFSKNIKKLDVGGMLVTLHRLINDYTFIQKIKLEFIENKWNELIIDGDYEFSGG